MNTQALNEALALAARVPQVMVATADAMGRPHLAAAARLEDAGDGLVALEEWFCPGTVLNAAPGRPIALAVWDPAADQGYQLLGAVERVDDLAMLDGYAPAAEAGQSRPQVQRRLVVCVATVLDFTLAPHSDEEEPVGEA